MASLPIFRVPSYQNKLVESYQDKVNTMGDTRQGPIEFNITGNNDLIDLTSMALHVSAKITKADGSAYAADSSTAKVEVAFINNVLHSLFSDIIVSINDTIVEGGELQYNIKSMINTLFTYSTQTMEKHLFASGFVKDQAGKMDDVANTGYVARKGWTSGGASKDFYGKLFVDMFQQHRYLISNVNMRIKLIKAAYNFTLSCNMTGEKPKLVIESAKLYFKRVKPHPSILQNIEANLSRGGMVHYPINRIDIVSIPVAANTLDIFKEQLFYGRVPKMIVMAMADNEAMSGVYNKNPFNFKHNDVKHLDLRISGTSKPLLPLMPPNFKGKSCLREYMSLLETMSILGKD